ncbi:MAG: penicillin-binding protein [Anaerolineales bacterium]|nr:penicillin-binding protein [Anaerolineales bacterium]
MTSTLPILRARRERRLAKQKRNDNRSRGAALSVGLIVSMALGAALLLAAFAYADVVRDLPSTEILPLLLDPPNGALLQPTRVYDRSGTHLLKTFAPDETPRRYISVGEINAQTLAAFSAVSESDLALAQKLIADLILYNEAPSLKRDLRQRLLALQILSQFGREKIVEWTLNSADFGTDAYGIDSAARLYFGKPAAELNLNESAMLAATSESPALNPFSAPQTVLERSREILEIMRQRRLVSAAEIDLARTATPAVQPAPQTPPEAAPAFLNLVLAQAESQIPRARLLRGGMTIISTLDYDLQQSALCLTELYAARLAVLPYESCPASSALPSLPPHSAYADSSVSAVVLDPTTGQILALVGETNRGAETPLLGAHPAGSAYDAFAYLAAFARGFSPASLTWDIPSSQENPNFDSTYRGAMRLRIALANDIQVPLLTLKNQVGAENVAKVAASFGLNVNADASMLDLASAYGVFAAQGVRFGQIVDEKLAPSALLRVEDADHNPLMDWSLPKAQTVVTPAMSYLTTDVLSDEAARRLTWGRQNVLEIGRPVGVKPAQTADGKNAWTIGYTPYLSVVVWSGVRGEDDALTPRFPAALWSGIMQVASQKYPSSGWALPPGLTPITVCDPSGMLPTRECPNLVGEIFLNGSEPTQADNLFREFYVNRETGLLATVFTPPELAERRVYMLFPDEARAWAQSADLPLPPSSYDAIQAPPINPYVNISAPALFAEVSGKVLILGAATGDDFSYYRVQIGKGINPQEWIQLGEDRYEPVNGGLLAEWDTTNLSGLYAVQLTVVRADQKAETAIIQVTVK